MQTIEARNAHEALPVAIELLRRGGVERQSRAGKVLVYPTPVTTHYREPQELVVFHPARDANPYFHLFEGLWMLAGRRDVAFIREFNGNIAKVASDDGEVFHGAYGHRWQHHFGIDQLGMVVDALKANPEDRRVVLQMWNPTADLGLGGKDFPCNLCCHVEVGFDGAVDLKVFCRSNDVLWGCYGSDSVTFGMLLEYLAARIQRPVGDYWQISSNWHGYVETLPSGTGGGWEQFGRYQDDEVTRQQLMTLEYPEWEEELQGFVQGHMSAFRDPTFSSVAAPMRRAWRMHKKKETADAIKLLLDQSPRHNDWATAAREWLERRLA